MSAKSVGTKNMSTKKKTIVASDIDGTLIQQNSTGMDVPRYDVIHLLLSLEKFGCEIYLWSGSGVDYCKTVRNRLGLNRFAVIAKGSIVPDLCLDDIADVNLGKVNLHVG